MRFIKLGLFSVLAAVAAGCNPNPYCLNCGAGDGGGADLAGGPDMSLPDLAKGDLTPIPDLAGDGICIPTNNGVEICDHIDNDCNGKVDDVAPAKLASDPNNCSACFMVCSYVNAFGVCTNGVCSEGPCQPGYYNNNNDPKGCMDKCNPTLPPTCKVMADCQNGKGCNGGFCADTCTDGSGAGDKGGCPANTACRDIGALVCVPELCDGIDNNCNGVVDEGFDTNTDPNNCGGCGIFCNLPNAMNSCVNGMCTLGMCNIGFKDLNMKPGDGCEYQCPVYPPVPEICNGIDDDCDGQIDNNVTDVGKPCDDFCPALAGCVANNSCGFKLSTCAGKCCGVCTEGKTICAAGAPVCQMGMGPALEVCDNVDNNCDGQIDEGFNLQTDPVNCGACNNKCNLPNAIAGCAAGKCTIATCKPGFADLDKNPANGCEYTCPVMPPSVETCNNKDDDCDGVVDNAQGSNVVGSLPPPPNFCQQTTICAGAKPVCCGANGWLCNYPSVNAHIEVTNQQMCEGGTQGANLAFAETLCDGFDGNCNSQIDETFPQKGKACTTGNGLCQGASTFVCNQQQNGVTCPAVANPNAAVDESCNGIDDDCDGQTDERTPMNGSMCFNGGAHACKGWVDNMIKVNNVWVYQYEASHPDATGGSVGNNGTRACSNAAVLPWAPVTETAAAAACAAVLDSNGSPMRLCTAAEWQTACNLGNATNPIWSYAAGPTTYVGATCNGFDRGLGAAWATGSGAACYSNPANQMNGTTSAGKIYDLSGNLAEWTSTQVMANNKTYYQVKGGAFNNFANGINCDFSFTIEQPTYQFTDLGYRCCADHAP
jgi:hypothetical protein